MTYVVPTQDGPRTYQRVDLQRLAADLAKKFKGNARPWNPEYPAEKQCIKLSGDVELTISADRYSKDGKVSVSIRATDVKHEDRNFGNKEHSPADAAFNPDKRSLDQLVSGIKKRVIEASAEAIAKQRAYAADRNKERGELKARVAELKKAIPDLVIREEDSSGRSCTVWGGANTCYVQATLYADGTVSFHRLESTKLDTFVTIMKLLSKNKSK